MRGEFDLGRRTLECTRRSMALKVHLALATYGTKLFGDYVTATFDLARRFADMLEQAPDFELALRPQSNIVCFRYRPPGIGEGEELDALQRDRRRKVVRSGAFFFVQTQLAAGTFLRTTLIHPFTTDDDLRELLDAIRSAV
jgi:L-2,4-diaminobutyrate decarboxylase